MVVGGHGRIILMSYEAHSMKHTLWPGQLSTLVVVEPSCTS